MRFMMLMIPAVYQGAEGKNVPSDFAPPADAVEQMTKYNEKLAKSEALISLDGLHPMSKGARVSYGGNKPQVTDGPFVESKEVLGGYWIIKAGSKEEAVEWARQVPAARGDVVEVRQIFDWEDFPADVQKAGDNEAVKAQVAKHAKS